MAIQRPHTTRMKTDLIIAVLDANPALGAPTPKFRKPVKQVTVGGRPWQRFDEGRVQLPIALGQITVQTQHGTGTAPRLARSTMDFPVWEWSSRDGKRTFCPFCRRGAIRRPRGISPRRCCARRLAHHRVHRRHDVASSAGSQCRIT